MNLWQRIRQREIKRDWKKGEEREKEEDVVERNVDDSVFQVNERIAISVSSSPFSQVGVGVPGGVVGAGVSAEYAVSGGIAGGMGGGGRGDRPRISLLPPAAASVPPTPSPTAPDYQQHVSAAAARNPRVGLMPVQPDQYCSRTGAVDMAGCLQQDTPPFKKIRLGQPHQQVQQLQSQPQSRCQSLSPADTVCKQEPQQQHVVQLQQPLRIDTRVGVEAMSIGKKETTVSKILSLRYFDGVAKKLINSQNIT